MTRNIMYMGKSLKYVLDIHVPKWASSFVMTQISWRLNSVRPGKFYSVNLTIMLYAILHSNRNSVILNTNLNSVIVYTYHNNDRKHATSNVASECVH